MSSYVNDWPTLSRSDRASHPDRLTGMHGALERPLSVPSFLLRARPFCFSGNLVLFSEMPSSSSSSLVSLVPRSSQRFNFADFEPRSAPPSSSRGCFRVRFCRPAAAGQGWILSNLTCHLFFPSFWRYFKQESAAAAAAISGRGRGRRGGRRGRGGGAY